jgi:hypothetical protein
MQLAGPYQLDDAAWGMGFVYAPMVSFLFAPLLVDPVPYLWNLLNVAAFVTVGLAIVRKEWGHMGGLGTTVTLAVLLVQPGLREVNEGQVSPAIAALFGAMWIAPRWSGVLAGAAGAIKLFPLLGLVWAWRQRAPLIGPLAITAVVSLIGLVFVPGWYRDWIVALVNARPGCPSIALPSFGCAGVGWVGYAMAFGLAIAARFLRRDENAFALLSVAFIVPAADLYWGYMLIPFLGFLPLAIRLLGAASGRLVAESSACLPELRASGDAG